MLSYRKLKSETLCDGLRPYGMSCNGSVYKCTACGNTGCSQTTAGKCSKQAFNALFTCLQCGAVGKQELLTAVKYEPISYEHHG